MHNTLSPIFNLTGLLPLFPFLAFVLIVLWANSNKKLSAGLALGGIGLSWVVGWGIAFTSFGTEGLGEEPFRAFADWLPTSSAF
jgi:NADH:ubiquinone oxidoreductase subunit 5 (subunit L)/multisubunit Na+/H+ antiporter MnhA subunit